MEVSAECVVSPGTSWLQEVRVWEAADLYWTGTKAARVVQSPMSRDFCLVLGDSRPLEGENNGAQDPLHPACHRLSFEQQPCYCWLQKLKVHIKTISNHMTRNTDLTVKETSKE